jgi:hypothetical protein
MAYNNQQQQYNETLTPICFTSFASNHLLQISIVQRTPTINLNKPDIKDKIFAFVTLAPGDGTGNNRTYNFQNKITQKFNLREIEGLSFILRQLAIGNQSVLPYSKFTRSQQGQKMLSVWMSTKTQQLGQQQYNIRNINITIDASGAKSTLTLTVDQAYSLGSVLNEMFRHGLEREFKLQEEQPSYVQNQASAQSLPFNQPQQQMVTAQNQPQQPVMQNQPQMFNQPQPTMQNQPQIFNQPGQQSSVDELKTEFQNMF